MIAYLQAMQSCRHCNYISTTSVYGEYKGIVNESTPVDEQADRSKLRLQAEQIWLEKGAIICELPAYMDQNLDYIYDLPRHLPLTAC